MADVRPQADEHAVSPANDVRPPGTAGTFMLLAIWDATKSNVIPKFSLLTTHVGDGASVGEVNTNFERP